MTGFIHAFFSQPYLYYKRFSVSHPGSNLFNDTVVYFKFENENTIQIYDINDYFGYINDTSNIKKNFDFSSILHNLFVKHDPYLTYYPYVKILKKAFNSKSYFWVENVPYNFSFYNHAINGPSISGKYDVEGENVWNSNYNKYLPLHKTNNLSPQIQYSYWIGNGIGWFIQSVWRTAQRNFLNAGYIQLGIQKACAWFYILDSMQKRKSSLYKDTAAFTLGASSCFNACFQDNNNSYIMAGKINIQNGLGYISKMRPSLGSYASYIITCPAKDSGEVLRARQSPDGSYLLSGHLWENGKRRLFLMKVDSSLQNIQWAYQINPKNASENLYMTDLLHEKDNRFVLTGGNGMVLLCIPLEVQSSFSNWVHVVSFREKGMFCYPARARNLYNSYNKIYHFTGILKDSINPQIRATFFLRTDTTFKITDCLTPKTSLYFNSDSLPIQSFSPLVTQLSNAFPDTLGVQVYTVSNLLLNNSITGTISFPVHQTNFSSQWQPTVVLNGTNFCEDDKITFQCFPAPPVVTNYYYMGPNQFTAQPATQQFNILMAKPHHTGIYTIQAHFNSGCITTTQTPLISVFQRPDTSVTMTGSMLVANQVNASYQWLDCFTNQPHPNGINQFYIVTQPGYYKVAINLNGCRDTSRCFPIGVDGLNKWNSGSVYPWKIGPNPNSEGIIYIYPPDDNLSYSCEITDLLGRTLLHKSCKGPSILNASYLTNENVYLLIIKSDIHNVSKIFKFVINK